MVTGGSCLLFSVDKAIELPPVTAHLLLSGSPSQLLPHHSHELVSVSSAPMFFDGSHCLWSRFSGV